MDRFRDLFRARHRLSNQSSETSSSSSRSDDESYTPDPYVSDEFCNAFWGKAGYQQILKRSKISEKIFYKERASIESDYSKRLTRLSKSNLFEAIGYEVRSIQHKPRADLSKTIKKELQQKVAEFIARREGARKNPQATVEKLHKKLIELQSLQEKARKRFEADAIAVTAYGAQMHLVQGREMDRVSAKLDKAKANIGLAEKKYQVLTKALQETVQEWTLQWKNFCDLIQDLEEDRLDFIKSSAYEYTSKISFIVNAEDEQFEIVRQILERCDTERDINQFIARCGTGAELYTAPEYIDYLKGQHDETPVYKAKSQKATANFSRNSCRTMPKSPKKPPRVVQEFRPNQAYYQDQTRIPEGMSPMDYKGSRPNQVEYRGTIAHMIALNSMEPGMGHIVEREVKLKPQISYENQIEYIHDPHHHEIFDKPGILVNHSKGES
ncbi:hypothetical protein DFH28DRAFT_1006742 [Melampsora americana]|nr:hypothetical protein DFH28DRAFT_1006742 [Melampsora americana]